ncbi:hypothetical protein NDU88_003632 [Pleurodeles waltl]|uniref:Uncharacterized protein n=1 Tax=Pleurodeles waltl TaxID=8319 RepID=A0AAV7L4E9_PLEWA|nr:hypothetical protein NDU88_003632 [Pleurodeles waltl]
MLPRGGVVVRVLRPTVPPSLGSSVQVHKGCSEVRPCVARVLSQRVSGIRRGPRQQCTGAIRASHTPHTPTDVARKRRGSRSVERNRSVDLGRALRSHLLAGPSGACRRGHDPCGGHQKAVKRLQQSVLQTHGVHGICGFCG